MQVCCDLYSAATTSSLPSDETVKLLAEVLYVLPDLGDALLRAVGLVRLRLETHITCLHHALDELSDVAATGNVSGFRLSYVEQNTARFYRLLALFDVGDEEAAENKEELQQLWLRIVQLLSSGMSALNRSTVLSCLLSQKSQSVCRRFVKMLDSADLRSLISRTAASQFSSAYNRSTASSYTAPTHSFNSESALCTDKTHEVDAVADDAGTVDKSELIFNLPSNVGDDIVPVIALSSTSDHHKAWYHLYLTCFDRKIHFLDLFLVSNMTCVVVVVIYRPVFHRLPEPNRVWLLVVYFSL